MAQFQQAPVWRVEPDLGAAVAVPLSADTAYPPPAADPGDRRRAEVPDRLRFLVSVLGVATSQGWRIAALFTTTQKFP